MGRWPAPKHTTTQQAEPENTGQVCRDLVRGMSAPHKSLVSGGHDPADTVDPAGTVSFNTASDNAVFGILAILVLEFRTFKSTLVVASVIPLGIVGGIVALWLSGNTLSFAAMIGFVALIGIEIKTSILLVDFTDELRRQGYSLDDAIQRAGEVRFVPIVLTTMTAIGGMLPLALQGSSLYSPLAWVIIGGLVSSTLIARLVTPVMYRLLAPRIDFTQEHPVPEARPTATGAEA